MLAGVSMVFGMLMAVAQDLPQLDSANTADDAENSVLVDVRGKKVATLTGDQNRILVDSTDIARSVKEAVVAVEDRRYYDHGGVDYVGIGRALVEDIRSGSAAQGGSTITQQFVKNAVSAQDTRTVLQKLREAALAYNLERKWSKDKILTQYLNTVYFGEGAYGIEAAARTYFRGNHPDCGNEGEPNCASVLEPEEAALLAAIIASPSKYAPRANPEAALGRRNLVLRAMRSEGFIDAPQLSDSLAQALPADPDIKERKDDSKAPYFTSWVRQHVVDLFGTGRAFTGGLKVKTSLDLELQRKTEEAVSKRIGTIKPRSAVVVIDNKTGGVRAMVGGKSFADAPFNLATSAHRQPGSAFKPFILARALEQGISPNQTYASKKKVFDVPNSPGEKFVVNNYKDTYSGTIDLASATTFSDNSVYAELGIKLGTKSVARMAKRLGVTSSISTNPSMVLGGLKRGVTPLEMAYAYSTLARDGKRITGTLAPKERGPVGLLSVREPDRDLAKTTQGQAADNDAETTQAIPQQAATKTAEIMRSVVQRGTGRKASLGPDVQVSGKTGTTENNGDAWFIGFTDEYTIAVWVGYPDKTRPMETEYHGQPVDGGTYPAEIWHDVAAAYEEILDERDAAREAKRIEEGGTPTTPQAPAPSGAPAAPQAPAPEPAPAPEAAPEPAPAPEPEPAPAPAPEPAPSPAASAPSGGQGARAEPR
ncbi:MAG: transglycosylase domain-containing protein [Solirubrobacterales bacterium]